MLRTAGYARVSTDMDTQDGSFESQVEFLANIISQDPSLSLVRIYGDHGISGRKIDSRPELQELIADAENGLIDLIYTKSLSRLARNMKETVALVRKLSALGVHLIFLKEGLDTRTMKGELILSLLSALAESESDSISENTKLAWQKAFMRGELWMKPAYGYKRGEGKDWIISEPEASHVRTLFSMAVEGRPLIELQHVMTDITGQKWDSQRVRRALQNEAYLGGHVTHKKVPVTEKDGRTHYVKNNGLHEQFIIEDHHEALISREDFEKAQANYPIKRRPTYKRKTKTAHNKVDD